jgi:hypothetical protein
LNNSARCRNLSDSKSPQKAATGTITVSIAASHCAPKLSESLVNGYREVNSRVPLAPFFVNSNLHCVG